MPAWFYIARKPSCYVGAAQILACGTDKQAVQRAAVREWNRRAPDPHYPATATMVELTAVPISPVHIPNAWEA
jgi:hypothetical protein